jgi:hypothetical protein
MSIETFLILLIGLLALVYLVVPPIAGAFLRYRGKRLVTCPQTRKTVAVDVDAKHAALTAAVSHPDLRLKTCTRWPERQDCGQECLLQVELSPEDCLVRNILTSWYSGKYCVSCGTKLREARVLDHQPALLDDTGQTIELADIALETIPAVLASHYPVCWDCHITETFARKHPDLVVDRSKVTAGIQRQVI